MKKVETERFQTKKPEEISFRGAPLPENPPRKVEVVRTSVRTSVRPSEIKVENTDPQGEISEETNKYSIEVPAQRRKIRHPFDIYEDQLDALKKIQIAERESSGGKERTLGDMAREALDYFIEGEAERSENIKISREQEKLVRPSVRPDVRTE